MNQPPGLGNQGPQYYPGQQPPRRGRPWWVWVLGGCGGCAAVVIIAGIILVVAGVNYFQSATKDIGPVNQTTVQQSMGEVPLYPGSAVDVTTTEMTLKVLRPMEKLTGKKIFRGTAVLTTSDSPDKVLTFYDKKLKALGWTKTSAKTTGIQEQHQYTKGPELLLIQVQNRPGAGGAMITLMRGGPEIANYHTSPGGSP
jgi:hypothetical protein